MIGSPLLSIHYSHFSCEPFGLLLDPDYFCLPVLAHRHSAIAWNGRCMPEAWCQIVDLRDIGMPNLFVFASPFPFGVGDSIYRLPVPNLTLVKHIFSAEDSYLIPGWINQNHSHMMRLSHPPNERFVIGISCSGGPRALTYPTDLILRSDLRLPFLSSFPTGTA